jgi:UDP-N-acetylmuramate--alanine ligase
MCNSELIEKLKEEGCIINIGNKNFHSLQNIQKVIYTEAVPKTNPELIKAKEL